MDNLPSELLLTIVNNIPDFYHWSNLLVLTKFIRQSLLTNVSVINSSKINVISLRLVMSFSRLRSCNIPIRITGWKGYRRLAFHPSLSHFTIYDCCQCFDHNIITKFIKLYWHGAIHHAGNKIQNNRDLTKCSISIGKGIIKYKLCGYHVYINDAEVSQSLLSIIDKCPYTCLELKIHKRTMNTVVGQLNHIDTIVYHLDNYNLNLSHIVKICLARKNIKAHLLSQQGYRVHMVNVDIFDDIYNHVMIFEIPIFVGDLLKFIIKFPQVRHIWVIGGDEFLYTLYPDYTFKF